MEEKAGTSILVLSGTVLVLSLALINGSPFFYFDSATYIEQIAKAVRIFWPSSGGVQTVSDVGSNVDFGYADPDKIVYAGRSVYYGALAWAGWVSSIWVPVVLQGATLSWLIVTLFRQYAVRWWWQTALLSLAALGVLSSAGLFVGLVMPDIWAGLMVLALALYWGCCDRLSLGQKTLIFIIMAFSVLVHNSHLALLTALLGCLALARFAVRRSTRAPLSQFALPIGALCIGIAGQMAFSAAVRIAYDAQLLSRPHITAHLVELGPGTQLIKENCPQSDFALCAYADRLPVDWINFLFQTDPGTGVFAVAPLAIQKALIAEQARFALQVLSHYPLQTMYGLTRDGFTQLWTLDIDDLVIGTRGDRFITRNFPADLALMIENSGIYNRSDLMRVMFRFIQIFSVAATVFLLFYALKRGTLMGRAQPQLETVVLVMVAGLVLNALICGILASPYGRFQARIVWLLPLGVALIMSNLPARRTVEKRFGKSRTLT